MTGLDRRPQPEEVRFSHGGESLRMVLSRPAGETPQPAIILIPDVRGIYDHFIDVAGRLAHSGFLTATVDLYSREGAPDIVDVDSALQWMASLPDRRVLQDLAAYRSELAARDDVDEHAIAITGFCMGGQYALMAGCSLDGFAACVSWYGMLRHAIHTEHKLDDPLDSIRSLRCPYLGFFGEQDALIPASQVAELRAELGRLSVESQIVTYPQAGHAFFNDSRPAGYVAEAAEDAWPRALAFFTKHLRPGVTRQSS